MANTERDSIVANDVAAIRTAVYGRDVREAIADGIEHCYFDISTAKTLADDATEAASQAAIDASTAAIAAQAVVDNMGDTVDDLVTDVAVLKDDVDQMNTSILGKVDNGYVEDGVAYFTSGDDVLFSITGIGGGGGGGGGGGSSGNNAVITAQNTTGWLTNSVAVGSDVVLSLDWSSIEDGSPTGDGTLYILRSNVIMRTMNVSQGEITINVKEFLSSGANAIKLRVEDSYGNQRTINYSIRVVDFTMTSTFDPDTIYSGSFTFPYVATGEIDSSKTVYLKIDGSVADTQTINDSGRQKRFSISSLSHGSHTIECWFEATSSGSTISSNVLKYDILYTTTAGTATIISSNFEDTTAPQYSSVLIDYMVYTPNYLTSAVTISVNGVVVSEQTVDRTRQKYSLRLDEEGTNTIVIASGGATRTIYIEVEATDMAVAETDALVLYLTSFGRSNNESAASRNVWHDTDNGIEATMTGFNFSSDGWMIDSENNAVLRVAGDARVTIPYKMFENDFRSTGKTIEIEFTTRSVLSYDTVLVSCIDNGIGFTLTPQKATLTSAEASIETQYKEDDHVRLSFVVEKRAENRLILVYVNGIPSGVVQYPVSDNFAQANPVDITIGSSLCGIDIYCIRVYDNDLPRRQVLHNMIADTRNIDTMTAIFERNNVYVGSSNTISLERLPATLPYMILDAAQLPQYKGDKKTITGTYVEPLHPEKSFTFIGCEIDVQGTSSAPYARKNYDMKFKKGFEMTQSGEHADTFLLDDSVLPFNRFVMKADVASSEGANNVELVKLYCEITPYKTREMLANPKVRQGIYGFPIVIFWHDTTKTENAVSFLGKYNFNFPKRAAEPYGYSGNMESWEFQNNTSNLMLFKTDYFDETMRTDPETGVTKETWRFDYEARFPDDTWVDYAKLQELQSFIVSTDRDQATGDALSSPVTYDGVQYTHDSPEYRLAKFKNEFGRYAEIQSFIFYYVYTELFLMIDSRAKNLFIGFTGSDTDPAYGLVIDRKAVAEPYDMDTGIGTNNEGVLKFDFSLEDTDHLAGGENVFNGQTSVLWNNVRDAFGIEIQQMYQSLRSAGTLSYNYVESKFEEHQAVWPEAIWLEDSWFKYIDPLISPDPGKEATAFYLPMMQGSKKEQRKWWLYNRFRYMDSKWNAGDALTDVITLRAYSKGDITVTPYADIYPTIKYASYVIQERGQHGVPSTLHCPMDYFNDTEIYIYSASQIADVGDLSPLMVNYADFANATRLQSIKLGDLSTTYNNSGLVTLYLGTNEHLVTLDVRNCSGLGTAAQKTLDLSGCANIENVYLRGTSLTGVNLPVGGVLKILQLPSTVTRLEIRNHPLLTTFELPNASNLTSLWVENVGSGVRPLSLLASMPANSTVRIINFPRATFTSYSEARVVYDALDQMRGLDEHGEIVPTAQVSGSVHINRLTQEQYEALQSRYPSINLTYSFFTFELIYMNEDGTQELHRDSFTRVGDGTWNSTPTKSQTAQYTYTFVGWSLTPGGEVDPNATKQVTANRTIYAVFTPVLREYRIQFVNNDDEVLQDSYIPYGTVPEYTGETPVHSGDNPGDYEFFDWDPAITAVTIARTYRPIYIYSASKTRAFITKQYGKVLSDSNITALRYYAFSKNPGITNVDLSNVTSAGGHVFDSCQNLKTANLPNVTRVTGDTFRSCSNLTTVNMPLVENTLQYDFYYCSQLTTANFPRVPSLSYSTFYRCESLTSVYIPAVSYIRDSAFSGCTSLTQIALPGIDGDSSNDIMPNSFNGCTALTDIYVAFSELDAAAVNAPWGAVNATIHYNTTFDIDGNPVT